LTTPLNHRAAGKLDQIPVCSLQTRFKAATSTKAIITLLCKSSNVVAVYTTKTTMLQSQMYACVQILGLDRAATWREVKAAYKRLALSLHPDKQRSATPDQAAAVAHKFLEVAEAHDVLTNEEQRAAYDKVRDYMVGRSCCCDSTHT